VFELVDVQHALYVPVVVTVSFEQHNVEEVLLVEVYFEEPFDFHHQHNNTLMNEEAVDDEG
jgi:hypothetical protein